jgi:ADP-ribosylglycohydrolase
MEQTAFQKCMHSKANGSLMRATPLGIWGHRLSDDELAYYAQCDSKLSHPNLSCQHAEACYVIAIASLMRNLGGCEAAFQRVKLWAEGNAVQEVRDWLQDAEDNVDVPYEPQIGFVKIAFTHAFRHLLLGSDYTEAIRETLTGGGDTDTNACIVGGLVGAASGVTVIPEGMQRSVLHCDTAMGEHRPPFVSASQIPDLVDALLDPGAQRETGGRR